MMVSHRFLRVYVIYGDCASSPPEPVSRNRLLVPHSINRDVLRSLRQDGWITVSLFQQVDSLEKEAKRLNCSHIFSNNRQKD